LITNILNTSNNFYINKHYKELFKDLGMQIHANSWNKPCYVACTELDYDMEETTARHNKQDHETIGGGERRDGTQSNTGNSEHC